MGFLFNWLISGLAIVIAAYLLPGIRLSGFFAALVTALMTALRPGQSPPPVRIPTLRSFILSSVWLYVL